MDRPLLAKDVMVTRLVTLSPATPVFDGIARLLRFRVSGAPVIDRSRRFLGVLSERRCLRVLANGVRSNTGRRTPDLTAKDIMATNLVTLRSDMDVFDAIGYLLRNRISGAPVVDDKRNLLGSFSQKTSMSVLIGSAYAHLPTSTVSEFMKCNENSVISEDIGLTDVADTFLNTEFRRLQVVRDGKLVGQVSPRDVLRAVYRMSSSDPRREELLQKWQEQEFGADNDAFQETAEESSATDSASNGDQVDSFLNPEARRIDPETDLLQIAHIFRDSLCRRLPVVDGDVLVGQVSRMDVLQATNDMIRIPTKRERPLLYLSSLVERDDAPIS